MHNYIPPARRALAAGALALALAACVDQPGLFAPTTETPISPDSPILRLGTDTLALREGDRLSFPVNARGRKSVQSEIFLVDSARNVLWRSGTGPPVRDSASISFTGLPADLARGRRVFLTGALVDEQGKRVYATRDTLPVASLALAALQPAIVYEGHLLAVEGRVVALAAARDLGRVYFADQVKGTIGVVDLAALALRPAFAVGAHPEALAYMRGRLGVLSDAGVEVAAFDVAAGNRLLSKTIIPPLLARMRVPAGQLDESGKPTFQSFRYQVRPYARNLALVCAGAGPDCPEVAAFGSSEMVDPGGGSQGVGLREVAFAGRTAYPFLAAPQFNVETVANDSVPAELTTVEASVPTGRDSIVYQAGNVGRCSVLNAGGTAIAASPLPGGPVFVAPDREVSDCKLDVPLIRLDRPDGPTATPAPSPRWFRCSPSATCWAITASRRPARWMCPRTARACWCWTATASTCWTTRCASARRWRCPGCRPPRGSARRAPSAASPWSRRTPWRSTARATWCGRGGSCWAGSPGWRRSRG
ncbi:MAG TPA: hypothetical protein VF647_03990 [Longimicrobium sp.]|jgi:hypothetical protein